MPFLGPYSLILIQYTLQLETELQYQDSFRIARTADEAKKFEDWLVHLPKVLWELGSNNLSTTEVIFRFLLRLFQRKSCLVHQEASQSYIHFLSLIDLLFNTDHKINTVASSPIFHHNTPIPGTTPWSICQAPRLFASTKACSRPRYHPFDNFTGSKAGWAGGCCSNSCARHRGS